MHVSDANAEGAPEMKAMVAVIPVLTVIAIIGSLGFTTLALTTLSNMAGSSSSTSFSGSLQPLTAQQPSPPIDGYATSRAATVSSINVTLSTSNSSDIIMVFLAEGGSQGGTAAISDADHLIWVLGSSITNPEGNQGYYWYAVAPTPLSSDKITATFSIKENLNIYAFGVSGINTSSPIDNIATVSGSTGTAVNALISTSRPNDTVVSWVYAGSSPTIAVPAGFNAVTAQQSGGPTTQAAFTAFPGVQTNTNVKWTWTPSETLGGMFVVALNSAKGNVGTGLNPESELYAYLPMTISNYQDNAAGPPFQMMVAVPAGYSSYEANNLQNVQFTYTNGTVIPSWLESGSAGTLDIYWLKLGKMKAGSASNPANLTVYMDFMYKQVNLYSQNGSAGEAPYLSPVYGEYDNGANVFTFYDSFIGSSLDSKWTGSGNIILNNGLTLGTGPSDTYIESNQDASSSRNLLEFYGSVPAVSSSTSAVDFGIGSIGLPKTRALYWFTKGGVFNAITATYAGSSYIAKGVSLGLSQNYLFGLYTQGTSAAHSYYSQLGFGGETFPVYFYTQDNYVYNNTAEPITIESQPMANVSTHIDFVRIRAYPPGGVMPSVNLEPVVTLNISFANGNANSSTAYGISNDIDTVTVKGIPGDEIELKLNGNIVAGPTTSGTLSYAYKAQVGSASFTAMDINNGESVARTLTVRKGTPTLSLLGRSYNFNGLSEIVYVNFSTYKSQVSGTLYINGVQAKNLNSSYSFTVGPTVLSSYNLSFSTSGNSNYTAANASDFIEIYPNQTTLPRNVIKHVIIITQENHAFDNYFGTYYGALGIPANACEPWNLTVPADGCVAPYLTTNASEVSLAHSWNSSHTAYNNGQMNGFVVAEAGPQTMSYYNAETIPDYWALAQDYVLTDHMFSASLTYSLGNHWFEVAANAPNASLYGLGLSTPAIASSYITEAQPVPTLADELLQNNISWTYYGTAENATLGAAEASGAAYNYWNPLLAQNRSYTAKYAPHFAPFSNIFNAISGNTLPSVSWVVPNLNVSEHPPANVTLGSLYVTDIIDHVENSSYWNNTLIIVTWDEYGGYYDQVAPPIVSGTPLGFRVPALIISPYSKQNYVDHNNYSFMSTMKFVEWNWNITSLDPLDAGANNILNSFYYNGQSRKPTIIPLSASQLNSVNSAIQHGYVGGVGGYVNPGGNGSSSLNPNATVDVNGYVLPASWFAT